MCVSWPIIRELLWFPGLHLAALFPQHHSDSRRQRFINLSSCDRGLEMCGYNSSQFSRFSPIKLFNFEIWKSTSSLVEWSQIPDLRGRRNGPKWHLVDVSSPRAMVLLTSHNYRTPIGRADANAGTNGGGSNSTRSSVTYLFVFNDQGRALKTFGWPSIPHRGAERQR